MIISCCFCLMQDLGWTFLLSEVNTTGKMIKIVIDIAVFFCFFQIFYMPSVKVNKQAMEIIASDKYESSYTKWEIVQLKLSL